MSYHEYQTSANPRLRNSCERCGRLRTAPCHRSLLDRVEGLREGYLDDYLTVDTLAEGLPDGWSEMQDDPEMEGQHLARLLRGYLAEFQLGLCDEARLKDLIATTQ